MEEEACSCWNDCIVFIQKPSREAWEENSLTTNPISCPDPRVDTKQSISQLFNSDFHRSHIYICWTVFQQKNPPIIKKIIWKTRRCTSFKNPKNIPHSLTYWVTTSNQEILAHLKTHFWANLIKKNSLFDADFMSSLGLFHASLCLI